MRSRGKKKQFNKVKEVKRRARMAVGPPPVSRVADRGQKRRRQAQTPKHKPTLPRLIESRND